MHEHIRVHTTPLTTQAAEGLPRRAWRVEQIEAMVKADIFLDGEHFELIGGEIVPMSPKGARHEWVKRQLNPFFQDFRPKHLEVAQETTLHLDDRAFLEPDFCVFRKGLKPDLLFAPEVLLAVEVADTSLNYDLGRKIGIYAAYGVREVWVVNALTLVTRIHRQLGANGYACIEDLPHTARVTPALVPELAVTLADLGLTPTTDA